MFKKITEYNKLLSRTAIIIFVAWFFLIAASLSWNIYANQKHFVEMSKNKAREHFNKDQAFRFWATSHGGIYVPATPRTPPNPNLRHIKDSTIVTAAGKKVTLMNPAYMIRQMMNDYPKKYGIRGRITSLKPIWQGNTPDQWEKTALKKFEKGVPEVFEFTSKNEDPVLRLMRPMHITPGCLKCHAYQNYKPGDVRGGVGVIINLKTQLTLKTEKNITAGITHLLIFLFGMTGLFFSRNRIFLLIHQREEITETLRESQKLLTTIAENYPDSYISIIEKDFTISFTSGREFKNQNLDPDSFSGLTIDEIFREHTDTIKEYCHKTFDGNETEFELFFNGQHQNYRTVPLYDEDGKINRMLAVVQNITEKKQVQEQIRLSLEEKEVLLREIHHRVKNNLQIISSLLDLQASQAESIEDQKLLIDSCSRIHSMALVHEKLYKSPQLSKISVKEYISELIDEIKNTYADLIGKIDFSISIDDVSLRINNAVPLALLINEVITNIVQHAFPDGRGSVQILFNKDETNTCRLEISDNGRGIPPETKFENPETLGLQLIKALSKQLNSTLVLEHSKGTRYTLEFSDDDRKQTGNHQNKTSGMTVSKAPYILLVEDEQIIALNIKRILESEDRYHVEHVTSGEAAIESVSQKKPRLILMDIFLDGQIDGIEAIERIKAACAEIPFIFISANTDQALVDRAMKLNPSDYIEKPVQKALLISKIEKIKYLKN